MADEVAADVEAIRGWKFKQPVPKRVCTREGSAPYLEKEFERDDAARETGRLAGVPDDRGPAAPEAGPEEDVPGPDGRPGWRRSTIRRTRSCAWSAPTRTRPSRRRPSTGSSWPTNSATPSTISTWTWRSSSRTTAARPRTATWSTSSVAEGSATVMMTQYMVRMQAAGKMDLAELLPYSKEEEAKNEAFLAAPPYFMAIMGTYVCGMGFLARGNVHGPGPGRRRRCGQGDGRGRQGPAAIHRPDPPPREVLGQGQARRAGPGQR